MFARLIWSAVVAILAIICGIAWWMAATDHAKEGRHEPPATMGATE